MMRNMFSGNLTSTQPKPPHIGKKSPSLQNKIIIGVVIIVLLSWASGQSWFPLEITNKSSGSKSSTSSSDDKVIVSEYSAVHLSNNQLYFGKIENNRGPYLILTDVFYFRQQTVSPEGNIRLLKLGGELHKPQDLIYFNRDHVLSTEQMKEDSKIVKSIMKYKAGEGN